MERNYIYIFKTFQELVEMGHGSNSLLNSMEFSEDDIKAPPRTRVIYQDLSASCSAC